MTFVKAIPALIVLLAANMAAADPEKGQFPYQGSAQANEWPWQGAAQGEWPWQLGGIHLPPPRG